MQQDEPTEVPAATVDESTPTGAQLAVPPDAETYDVLQVLDRHDEQLILEEFQRRALKVMLYDFSSEGRAMIDLSYSGVREAISLMNRTGKTRIGIVGGPANMVVEETTEEHSGQDDDVPPVHIKVTVWARDEVTGQTYTGFAVEPKFFKPAKGKNRGKVLWDQFAQTKALSKAERNALKKFLPEPLRQTMIAQYRGDREAIRTIQAGAGAQEMAELPPPLSDDEMVGLIEQADEAFKALREADPIAKPPGWFHAAKIRAWSSHESMRDLIGRIEKLTEEAKADE